MAAVITVLFRGDAPGQAAVTVVLAVAGAVVAVWLLVRPSAGAMVASALVGVAWLIAYAVLAVVQSNLLAALVTDLACGCRRSAAVCLGGAKPQSVIQREAVLPARRTQTSGTSATTPRLSRPMIAQLSPASNGAAARAVRRPLQVGTPAPHPGPRLRSAEISRAGCEWRWPPSRRR